MVCEFDILMQDYIQSKYHFNDLNLIIKKQMKDMMLEEEKYQKEDLMIDYDFWMMMMKMKMIQIIQNLIQYLFLQIN